MVVERRPGAEPGGLRPSEVWAGPQLVAAVVAVVVGIAARWWQLGEARFSFDEAFTAAYSSLPLDEIPGALAAHDSHPPLDYFLRHPLAGSGSELWLRAPSTVFSTAALVTVAWWMRRRGWFGVGVVALFALNPFQLLYGRQSRMYALMMLIGVLVGYLAERWQRGDERARIPIAVGALVLVGCFDHSGALFLAGGLFVLPGLRRDAAAWRWRAAPVVAVGVWALVWGASFFRQSSRNTGLWIPTTRADSLDGAVNGMVSLLGGTRWTATLITVAAGAALLASHRVLGRVWVALFVVPFVLMALAGLHYHVVLPRTLAASAWALPVGWAALVEWVARRWAAVAAVLAALLAVVELRSVPVAMGFDEGYSEPVAVAIEQVAPGDALVVHPAWLWPLVTWNGADGPGTDPPPPLEDVDGRSWLFPGAEPTGRTWIVEPTAYHLELQDLPSCGEWRPLSDEWELGCVVTGGS